MRDLRDWNYQELLRRQHRSRLLGWLAVAALLLLSLVVMRLLYFSGSARVTVASGKTESTTLHQFVLSLARDSSDHDLDVEPVIATGTIDMLDQVNSGRLDFAIVHGGIDMDRYTNIRQVGASSVAPVHLLVKKEYYAAVVEDLRNLRGRTINVGMSRHTVMYNLSQEILEFVGLAPKNTDRCSCRLKSLQARTTSSTCRTPFSLPRCPLQS